jgi:hypothetical protein
MQDCHCLDGPISTLKRTLLVLGAIQRQSGHRELFLELRISSLQRINGAINVRTRDRLVFEVRIAVRETSDLSIMLFWRDLVLSCQFNKIF